MKKILISFLLGAGFGITIGIAISHIAPSPLTVDSRNHAHLWQETLDFLIEEWTAPRHSSLIVTAGLPARMELPDARRGFFPDTVKALARHVQLYYNVPAGVTLAQYALESAWGMKNLAASNYFGHTFAAVKEYMPRPKFVTARERVMQNGKLVPGSTVRFANYRDIAECFETHGKYLSRSPLYTKAFAHKSAEDFARRLGERYATDPDYALKLIAIMRRYNLYGTT